MCKPYIGRCTRTDVKMTKDVFNGSEYCMILGKVATCANCGLSQRLQTFG